MPTYLTVAELSCNRPLWGTVPDAVAMPVALRERGSSWWRDNARFDLEYATTMASRGESAIATALLVRTVRRVRGARVPQVLRVVVTDRTGRPVRIPGLAAGLGRVAPESALGEVAISAVRSNEKVVAPITNRSPSLSEKRSASSPLK